MQWLPLDSYPLFSTLPAEATTRQPIAGPGTLQPIHECTHYMKTADGMLINFGARQLQARFTFIRWRACCVSKACTSNVAPPSRNSILTQPTASWGPNV